MALLLWASGEASASPRTLSQFVHDRWSNRDGLPHNVVDSLLASRTGYLWLGTQEGLVRFDGARFHVFDRAGTPGLAGDEVYALAEDASGDLWVGTLSGLSRRHGDVFETVPLGAGVVGVSSLLVEGDDLWIGTNDGLFRRRAGVLTRFGPEEGLPDQLASVVAAARGGGLLVGGRHGLARWSGARFERIDLKGFPSEVVSAVLDGADGTLWAGSALGLWRRRPGSARFERVAEIGERDVNSLLLDHTGAVWVGLSSGVARVTGDRVEVDASAPMIVLTITEDAEGAIWFGTSTDGLHRMREGSLVTLSTAQGLSSKVAWAVALDRDGSVLAAGDGGLDRLLPSGPAAMNLGVDRREPLSGILVDRAGALWVGTDSHGLLRRSGGVDRWFGVADGLGTPVRAIYQDPAGRLFLGARDGVYSVEGDRLKLLAASSSLVSVLAAAPDGVLWVGTTMGLMQLAQGELRRSPLAALASGVDVTALSFDRDGTAWVGTLGAGLWRVRGGEAFAFTRKQGLGEDSVFAILDDGLGNLWLSGNHGLRRVARRELEAVAAGEKATAAATLLGRGDGMREVECSGGVQPAGVRSADGRLWFPTIDGVVVVEPGAVHANPVPARALVEEVVADGRRRPLSDGLVLPPETRHVEVRYAAPSLSNAERVRFRHRLVGREDLFVDAQSERVVHYAGLGPGRYTFEVSAANESGVWSAPFSFGFEIEPRLWQRPAVQVAFAVLLLAAVVGLFSLRTRLLVEQKRALEARVQEELSRVQTLQGMLPICAWCKKVREDSGYWKQIEAYVAEHSQASFTHGICPDCSRKFE